MAMTDEANRVANHLVSIRPGVGHITTRKADLESLLLGTDGWLLCAGVMCDIRSGHLGAGVYRVTLEERRYD